MSKKLTIIGGGVLVDTPDLLEVFSWRDLSSPNLSRQWFFDCVRKGWITPEDGEYIITAAADKCNWSDAYEAEMLQLLCASQTGENK